MPLAQGVADAAIAPTGALISRLVEKDTRVSLERVIGEYEARRGAAAAGGAEQQQGGGVRADE